MSVQYLVNGKALSGYDAVSVYNGNATPGTAELSLQHEGATYQFTNAEHKATFEADTAKYTPKYGGYCSTALSEGVLVEANPNSSLVQDGELHVFYKDDEEDTRDEWNENPTELKVQAEAQWPKLNV